MTNRKVSYETGPGTAKTANLVGFYSAILTTVMTVVTFGFAMMAIPISGSNCPANCITYPYLDTAAQFPRDYLWMPLAIVLTLFYGMLMVSIHYFAPQQRKILSQMGLFFALMTAVTLAAAYFVQFSVVPISLMSGETEGITLLTQYNPHGVFIALEELGYLLMALSFLFMAFVFANKNRLETAVRWVFIAGFGLVILSLVVISFIYGLDRLDRFEVIAISVDWFVLIINGILLSIMFRRQLQAKGK
jgi:hypothetical protein